MMLRPLTAVSPIDGRYRKKLEELSLYFSELALIKYRVKTEVLYLMKLAEIKVIRKLNAKEKDFLISLFAKFKLGDAQEVKKIEKITNHDVKAVEYYLRKRFEKTSLKDLVDFIHFGLTSDDVNNLSYALILKDFLKAVYLFELKSLIKQIRSLAKKHKSLAMLARTHGQPASPTTLGKEMAVFVWRLEEQLKSFSQKIKGKLNGAVGNYHAHFLAWPKVDWIGFSRKFVESLGLEPNLLTTQIENHDNLAEVLHAVIRINNILLDFSRDIWLYIAFDYFSQKTKKREVGSSTMPHKINPIDFENAEGNLGVSATFFVYLANKLPVSRLQRDLSDSTVLRNLGAGFGHSLLAIKGLHQGLTKLKVNKKKILEDLKNNPQVLAEAYQIILKKYGVRKAYEKVKELVRGKKVTSKTLRKLTKNPKILKELEDLEPENYLGLAEKLTELI